MKLKLIVLFIIMSALLSISCGSKYKDTSLELVNFQRDLSANCYCGRSGRVYYIFTFKVVSSNNSYYKVGETFDKYYCILPHDEELKNYYKSKIGSIIYIDKDACNCPLIRFI